MTTSQPVHETTNPTRLRANAIGVVGMVCSAVAVTAPLTAIASNLTISIAFGAGVATVGVLVLVTAILAAYSVGFVRMSRQVVNAGAYFAYITFGLGRRAGTAAAMCAAFAYNVGVAAMAGAFGFFGSLFLAQYDIAVPWWQLAILAVVGVWGIAFRGLSISSRVNGVVALGECAFLLVLAVAVLLHQPSWDWSMLSASDAVGGNFGLAFVFCILTFAGFEASAALGEEARAARSSVGRATYISLFLLAFFFLLGAWTMIAGVPDVVGLAQQDPGTVLVVVAVTHLGQWVGPLLIAMVTFSFFAATLALHGLAARYMFSLAREGYLPRKVGTVHRTRQTPATSGTLQMVIALAVLTPFALTGADPLADMAPAIAGVNGLAIALLMAACCASIAVAGLRGTLPGPRWAVVIAPAVSGAALLACIVVILSDYTGVAGSDSATVVALPWVLVLAIGYGWVAAGRRRTGSFDLAEMTADAP